MRCKLIPLLLAGISICLLISSVGRAERLPVRLYTSADGLGSSFVNSLMRDSHGFLWICTRDGLSRFDGSRFVTYQVGDKNAPPGIEAIVETHKGIYWIRTTGGLYRFDPQTQPTEISTTDRPQLSVELVSEKSMLVYEDRSGNLWGGFSDGLYQLEDHDGKVSFKNVPLRSGRVLNIATMVGGSDGSLWIGTSNTLLRRLKDGREIYYDFLVGRRDQVTSLLEDREQRIWVGRALGVFVIKPESSTEIATAREPVIREFDDLAQTQSATQSPVRLPSKPGEIFHHAFFSDALHSKNLYQTSDGRLWISDGSVIAALNNQSFEVLAPSLPTVATGMAEDANGNLWLAGPGGLMRLEAQGLVTYGVDDGLNGTTVVTIGETRKGKIFLVGDNFSVSEFDGHKFHTVRPPVPASAIALWASNPVYQDQEREWWVLTNEGLFHFAAADDATMLASPHLLGIYNSHNGLKGDQILHIFEDSKGGLWISTRDNDSTRWGLSKWDRATKTFLTFSEADGFPSRKSVSAFAEDRTGAFWLGLSDGGLLRYFQGHFSEVPANLPASLITALHPDQQGRIWIASAQGGIEIINDPSATKPTFTSLNVNNGLASNNIRSFAEDRLGNIYAGTARGVDRITPDLSRVMHYSIVNGLAGDFITTAFRDSRGAIWFGTPAGLSRLIPESRPEAVPPPIRLSGLRIAGESHPVADLGTQLISNLDLNSNQNNLQIDFFAIDFNAGEDLRYQYLLEGADREWSQPTGQRTVNYSSLAPGVYRFMVRAVTSSGLSSPEPAIVSFRIRPPIWRRWWFILLVAGLLAAFVFGLDRYRVARLKEVRESEQRFRTLTETASDAIITVDENSRIVYINEAAEKIFGYPVAEMLDRDLTMLMPEYLRHVHRAGLERYLATGKRHIAWNAVELPGLHKDGHEIPLELSFGEFSRKGQRYFTGIARDVTERKRAEDELRRTREARAIELERVRKRIASDLHDDIGSSLTQISLLSEVVNQRIDGGDGVHDDVAQPLALIANSSRELVDAMSDIVWAINPQKDHLSDLTQRMRSLTSEVSTACGIRVHFAAPETEVDLPLGANLRREVFLIFKESINNIVKHSAATEANVEFHLDRDRLMLRVADNGRGFDQTQESDGHGLLSMRSRAQDIGGAFEMRSTVGRGTAVTLSVPTGERTGDSD